MVIAGFLAIGILTGILSSMFGFGGGFVLIPVMYLLLPGFDVPEAAIMHVAIGTSLAVMIVNSINSTISHHRKQHVIWSIFFRLAPAIAVGALLGGLSTPFVQGDILRYLFILLVVYTIVTSIWKKSFLDVDGLSFTLPTPIKTSSLGLGIGFLATLLGVGGSVLTVPFLRKRGLAMLHAVSLANPLSLPIAIVGAITSIATGLQQPGLPAWCFGFVYVPAFLGIVLGGFLGVPLGTRIAHRLPDRLFSKIYLSLLVVVVLIMVFE
ncbi:sulfite exporter TauE/SafE family protein [Brevibacillus reuszeri]|uniref:sulfite exporter TauE/SafE family protein n=1 Tax=Brevibacillus reuszeri TaxID=54915 RepID=UPI00289E2E90|nr:sulfite exporter TauE/SafE family protein [Brevibacillus reuszeri]